LAGGNGTGYETEREKVLQETQAMKDGEMIRLRNPSQVPENMSEEEAREFWDTHEITEEFLQNSEPVPEHLLPPVRTSAEPSVVYLNEDVLSRLRGISKGRVDQVLHHMVESGERSFHKMATSRAIEFQKQNAILAKFVAQVERPVGAGVNSFTSALSYYQKNRIEETTRRSMRRSFRRAAQAAGSVGVSSRTRQIAAGRYPKRRTQ